MTEQRVHRNIAVIAAADVAGYASLVRADEEGTLAAVKSDNFQVFDPNVAAHDGRIFKTMGDGLLAHPGGIFISGTAFDQVQKDRCWDLDGRTQG
jgi:class 3 adenylate cyclase